MSIADSICSRVCEDAAGDVVAGDWQVVRGDLEGCGFTSWSQSLADEAGSRMRICRC